MKKQWEDGGEINNSNLMGDVNNPWRKRNKTVIVQYVVRVEVKIEKCPSGDWRSISFRNMEVT